MVPAVEAVQRLREIDRWSVLLDDGAVSRLSWLEQGGGSCGCGSGMVSMANEPACPVFSDGLAPVPVMHRTSAGP